MTRQETGDSAEGGPGNSQLAADGYQLPDRGKRTAWWRRGAPLPDLSAFLASHPAFFLSFECLLWTSQSHDLYPGNGSRSHSCRAPALPGAPGCAQQPAWPAYASPPRPAAPIPPRVGGVFLSLPRGCGLELCQVRTETLPFPIRLLQKQHGSNRQEPHMGSCDRLGALFVVAEGLLVNLPRQGLSKEGRGGF